MFPIYLIKNDEITVILGKSGCGKTTLMRILSKLDEDIQGEVKFYDENNLEKFENFKGGEKYIEAKMYFDGLNRFMIGHIPTGGSVGEHVHETNSEVIYVISGNGYVIYDGQREELHKGSVHYCPKGHKHTMVNDHEEDLVYFAVVPEQ